MTALMDQAAGGDVAYIVKVSLTPPARASHTLQQAASEKRQGTKSRELGTELAAGSWGHTLKARHTQCVFGTDLE